MPYAKQYRVTILLLFFLVPFFSNDLFGQEEKLTIQDARRAAIEKAMQARQQKKRVEGMAAEIIEKREKTLVKESTLDSLGGMQEVPKKKSEETYLEKLQAHRMAEEEKQKNAAGKLPVQEEEREKELVRKTKVEKNIQAEEERLAKVRALIEAEKMALKERQENAVLLEKEPEEELKNSILDEQKKSDNLTLLEEEEHIEDLSLTTKAPIKDTLEISDNIEDYIEEKKIKKAWKPLMLESYNFSMENYKGQVVVMNYWFGNCKMCIQEIPHLNELVEKYRDENIVFLGMTTDMPDKALKVARKHKFKYKIVPMAKPIAEKMWVVMYPTHIVFDENGERIATFTGNAKKVLQELENTVAGVLNKK